MNEQTPTGNDPAGRAPAAMIDEGAAAWLRARPATPGPVVATHTLEDLLAAGQTPPTPTRRTR